MDLNDPMVQRALYAAGLPAAAALLLALLGSIQPARGKGCRRFTAFVVPLAALTGLVLLVVQPFHEASEPGGFGRVGGETWERWMWLLPAVGALLIAWPALLLPWPEEKGRRWLFAVATGLAATATAGVCVALARYEMQPAAYVWFGPLVGLAAFLLYPPATAGAGRIDLVILALVGLLSLPVLGLTEWHTAAMVASAVVVPTVVAAIIAVVFYGAKFDEYAEGLAAGAMVLPAVLVATAAVAWLSAHDLGWPYGLALALPPVAVIVGIWGLRLPRAMPILLAVVLALLATFVAVNESDLSPYLNITQSALEAEPTAEDDGQ